MVFILGYLLPSPIDYNAPLMVESGSSSKDGPQTESSPQKKLLELAIEKEIQSLSEPSDLLDTVRTGKSLRHFLLGSFKDNGGWFRLNVFDGNGNITEAFSVLYGLSDREIQELSRDAAKVREDHFNLAKANSEVTRHEDGSTRVVLNPFESAENLYASMLDSFHKVLGDERFSDFLDLGEREMRDKFNRFGAEKLVLEITPRTESVVGKNGESIEVTKYEIKETIERLGENSSRVFNGIGEDYYSNEFDLAKRLIEEKAP